MHSFESHHDYLSYGYAQHCACSADLKGRSISENREALNFHFPSVGDVDGRAAPLIRSSQ